MTFQQDTLDKAYLSRALEVCIHVGLFIFLATACLLILRPFLPLTAWGIVIAIAVYPGFVKVKNLLGGRNGLAATVCTLLLLAVLIVPVVLLTGSLVEGAQGLAARLNEGALIPTAATKHRNLACHRTSLEGHMGAGLPKLDRCLATLCSTDQGGRASAALSLCWCWFGCTAMDFLDCHCWSSSR